MSVFAISLLCLIFGIVFIGLGWWIYESDSIRFVITGFLTIIGVALVIFANLNIYYNGSEQEILWWLIWIRG